MKHKNNLQSPVILLIIIILSTSMVATPAYAGVIFKIEAGSLINTSSIVSNATQLAANANNVYAVWRDGAHVGFSAGTYAGGTTFNPSALDIGDIDVSSSGPKVGVGGSTVYVVWQNTTKIRFIATTTPSSLTAPTSSVSLGTASSSTGAVPVVINSTGSNVIVAWRSDSTHYRFAHSSDNFVTVNDTGLLGTSSATSVPKSIQLAAAGNNVYAAWVAAGITGCGTTNIGCIQVNASSNNGHTFGTAVKITGDAGTTSSSHPEPQIAASGNNVYVVWKDNSNEIIFSKSTDSGGSFTNTVIDSDAGSSVSSTPQVAVGSGNNIYVVWQDQSTGDIKLEQSTDSGASFGAEQNLSNTSTSSTTPILKATQTYIYVAWQEIQPADPDSDIYFRISTDDGAHFSGINNLSSTSSYDQSPAMAVSADKSYVTWEEHTTSTSIHDGSIKFTSATESPVNVYFLDSQTSAFRSQYKTGDQAKITITDTTKTASSSISVTITSSQTGQSITPTLTQSPANSGNFTGTISFTTTASSSGSILKVKPGSDGDTLTLKYNDGTNDFKATATIFPITISFVDVKTGSAHTAYSLSELEKIKVTDPSSAGLGTITTTITSNADATGISLVLKENPASSGTFEKDTLIAMTANDIFNIGDTGTITQTETDGTKVTNTNPRTITTLNVNSTSDSAGFNPTLSETSTNTFTGKLSFTTGNTGNGALKVSAGDILSINYIPTGFSGAGLSTKGLILPNTNSSVGAIQVTTSASSCNSCITATFIGATLSVNIAPGSEPGGGGGGLVRPGLVLDVIASLSPSKGGSSYVAPSLSLSSLATAPGALPDNIRNEVLNHDPFKPASPSYDNSFDYPFSIDGGGYVLGGLTNTIKTQTENTGTPSEIKLNIPSSLLSHVALYMNLRGDARDLQKSDTYIIYDKGKPLQVVDPHGYLADVKFDLTKTGLKNTIIYKVTFAKPMEKSDIDLRVWDEKLATSDSKILDAIQVEPSSETGKTQLEQTTAPTITTAPITTPQTSTTQNTAPVTESTPDLMPAIKDWGGYSPNPISDSDLLSKMGVQGQHIPLWVTNVPRWVVDGTVSEQDFENMIKYLASTGTIK